MAERKFRMVNEADAETITLDPGKALIIKDTEGEKVIAVHLGADRDRPYVNIEIPDCFIGFVQQHAEDRIGIKIEGCHSSS